MYIINNLPHYILIIDQPNVQRIIKINVADRRGGKRFIRNFSSRDSQAGGRSG
jgi:hypothetical protein